MSNDQIPMSNQNQLQSPYFRHWGIRHSSTAGVGIEPTPPGSEPSIAANSDYPAKVAFPMTQLRFQCSRIAGAGIEPADSWFKATDFYQQKLPRRNPRIVSRE